MARLDCRTHRLADSTLVECHVRSDRRERVTVEPTHDAPCWPPRRQGVPAAGWTAEGWTGTVGPESPRALGYATPAAPDDPPARIAASEPARDDPEPASPRDVLRALGDPRPPRDAVQPDGGRTASRERSADRSSPEPTDADGPTSHDERRLAVIEARVAQAEALSSVSSVDAARSAVADAGGIEAVRALVAQLSRDRAHLERLQRRAGDLRARADVEVPVDDLARLV